MDWKFKGQIYPMYDYKVDNGTQTWTMRDFSAVDALVRALEEYQPTHTLSGIESYMDKWATVSCYPKFDIYDGVHHSDFDLRVEKISEEGFWLPT